ncbi:MAG: DMT family transporter [Clostridia bacterium]|nr:DMT family transporter [Clostridia bacterium]
MVLAALTLVPVIAFRHRAACKAAVAQPTADAKAVKPTLLPQDPAQRRFLLLGGLACGVMLALGSGFQQLGINAGVQAGKAGFITALYIVLVPLTGLFFGKRPTLLVWVAVVLSAIGLYLLCMQGGFVLESGDILLLLCALSFTGHILVVDYVGAKVDGVKLSCIQFAVTAVICLTIAAFAEHPTWAAVKTAAIPILYAGILSGGVGYTLQIVAQKDIDPTIASLIMCLESVFAVLFGWLLLGDSMSVREYLGCGIMMIGIVLAQVPEKAQKQAS